MLLCLRSGEQLEFDATNVFFDETRICSDSQIRVTSDPWDLFSEKDYYEKSCVDLADVETVGIETTIRVMTTPPPTPNCFH